MSRVYNLGIEGFVLNSYEGWNETDVGVEFHNCDFKALSGLSRYDGYTLHLNYADTLLEIWNGVFMVYEDSIRLTRM